ncbi:MAG: hypothetical protein NTY19_04950 [Planctomycetota bacterium]|nr:hypothetical protein [Planctomycetota bacterium]
MTTLTLKKQEIPFDHPDSRWSFQASATKPFLATPPALDRFGSDTIMRCLAHLQVLARKHQGLDYLQVFRPQDGSESLWFIEDGNGGAITALLPSDY